MKGNDEPEFGKNAFNCPYCEVYAHQEWRNTLIILNEYYDKSRGYRSNQLTIPNWSTSECGHCGRVSFWLKDKLIYPKSSIVPLPNEDMPEEVKEDYLEAGILLMILRGERVHC